MDWIWYVMIALVLIKIGLVWGLYEVGAFRQMKQDFLKAISKNPSRKLVTIMWGVVFIGVISAYFLLR